MTGADHRNVERFRVKCCHRAAPPFVYRNSKMFIGPSLCKTVDNYVETLDNSTLSGHFRFTKRNIFIFQLRFVVLLPEKGAAARGRRPPYPHCFHIRSPRHLPTQKSLKIRVTTDSVTVSPVISPSAAIAPSASITTASGVMPHCAAYSAASQRSAARASAAA